MITAWDRIAAALKARGKTQSWLADQLGIERAAVANWKRRGVVPPGQYAAIAILFGESIGWVAGTEDARKPGGRDFTAMALRIAHDFDLIKAEDARLDAFARCIGAISNALDTGPPTP